MVRLTTQARPDARGLVFASQGFGPLLGREYFAAFDGVDKDPEQVAALVRSSFVSFAPAETARFTCRDRPDGTPLEIGDVLDIELALVGSCAVKVVHLDDLSLTLRTMDGHPEAGRITFAADRGDDGRPTFAIRSRTRANGLVNLAGFLVMGKQMQSRCWINYIGNVAEACGGHVRRAVKVRTRTAPEQPADRPGGPDEPILAIGGGVRA